MFGRTKRRARKCSSMNGAKLKKISDMRKGKCYCQITLIECRHIFDAIITRAKQIWALFCIKMAWCSTPYTGSLRKTAEKRKQYIINSDYIQSSLSFHCLSNQNELLPLGVRAKILCKLERMGLLVSLSRFRAYFAARNERKDDAFNVFSVQPFRCKRVQFFASLMSPALLLIRMSVPTIWNSDKFAFSQSAMHAKLYVPSIAASAECAARASNQTRPLAEWSCSPASRRALYQHSVALLGHFCCGSLNRCAESNWLQCARANKWAKQNWRESQQKRKKAFCKRLTSRNAGTKISYPYNEREITANLILEIVSLFMLKRSESVLTQRNKVIARSMATPW